MPGIEYIGFWSRHSPRVVKLTVDVKRGGRRLESMLTGVESESKDGIRRPLVPSAAPG